mmetsp:Transcript_51017/g.119318  ORF Transcript_51017/g.119318 Transcript_51017/m.119318 type:complete len:217 (-) Transcript_51017:1876-2526(-)
MHGVCYGIMVRNATNRSEHLGVIYHSCRLRYGIHHWIQVDSVGFNLCENWTEIKLCRDSLDGPHNLAMMCDCHACLAELLLHRIRNERLIWSWSHAGNSPQDIRLIDLQSAALQLLHDGCCDCFVVWEASQSLHDVRVVHLQARLLQLLMHRGCYEIDIDTEIQLRQCFQHVCGIHLESRLTQPVNHQVCYSLLRWQLHAANGPEHIRRVIVDVGL